MFNYLTLQADYGVLTNDVHKKLNCPVLVLDSQRHWEPAVPSQPHTICGVMSPYCTHSRIHTVIGKHFLNVCF